MKKQLSVFEEVAEFEKVQEKLQNLINYWMNFSGNMRQFITWLRSQNLFQEMTAREISQCIRSYERERERLANYWGGPGGPFNFE